MLGTRSEPRRGQMSRICDIRPLRVNVQKEVSTMNLINQKSH